MGTCDWGSGGDILQDLAEFMDKRVLGIAYETVVQHESVDPLDDGVAVDFSTISL